MAVNIVRFGNNTIMDISDSTVTPETLASGVVAYNAAGERIVGAMSFPEVQTQDEWKYKIYDDGTFEAWYNKPRVNFTINTQSGMLYRSNLSSLTLPTDLTNAHDCEILHASINVAHNNYPAWGMLASIYGATANYYALSGGSRGASPNYIVTAYVFGTYA